MARGFLTNLSYAARRRRLRPLAVLGLVGWLSMSPAAARVPWDDPAAIVGRILAVGVELGRLRPPLPDPADNAARAVAAVIAQNLGTLSRTFRTSSSLLREPAVMRMASDRTPRLESWKITRPPPLVELFLRVRMPADHDMQAQFGLTGAAADTYPPQDAKKPAIMDYALRNGRLTIWRSSTPHLSVVVVTYAWPPTDR
jgi:hypothetical protein